MQQSELILDPTILPNLFNQFNTSNNTISNAQVGVEVTKAVSSTKDCWICYDPDKSDFWIEPCNCKGDVASVHHECLKRWLILNPTENTSRCDICKCEYNIINNNEIKWRKGCTRSQWRIIAVVVICMSMIVAVCWSLVYLYDNNYIRILCATLGLLVIYICFRFLGQKILYTYQRAKVAALKIGNQRCIIIDNKASSAPT